MNCLNCGKEMTNYLVMKDREKLSYDMCEACGSLWLDKGELDRMAFQVEGSIEYSSEREAENTNEAIKKCPRCENVDMDKVYFAGYSDIVLDHCKNCGGFWLDGGELDLVNRELEEIMPIQGKGFSEFVNKAHLPYWFKRIKRKSSLVDFKVDALPVPGAKKIQETDFNCPVCQPPVKMNLYEVHGVEIESCPKCRGIFLDNDELRKLKDRSVENSWMKLNWVDDEVEAVENSIAIETSRFCPKCGSVKMIATHYGDSEILMDICPRCKGMWLDQDEFNEIISILKEKLMKMSPDEMKEQLKEELKEIFTGPEPKWEEIKDAKAALSAFLSISVFENPTLFKMLKGLTDTTRTMGF